MKRHLIILALLASGGVAYAQEPPKPANPPAGHDPMPAQEPANVGKGDAAMKSPVGTSNANIADPNNKPITLTYGELQLLISGTNVMQKIQAQLGK